MILVKVVQLIVDVDWLRNITVNLDRKGANSRWRSTIVILLDDTLDFLTHDVEGDAERQEDHSKDAEDNHGGAERGHGPPSWQHLLLELALLQLLNLLLDAHKVFFRDFHFFDLLVFSLFLN